jgi:hypothetical protein
MAELRVIAKERKPINVEATNVGKCGGDVLLWGCALAWKRE